MKRLFTFLIIGAVLCGSMFAQAQSNDAYPTGWLSRSIRGGGTGGTGDLKADGTVPLTANWPMGAFTLSQATWQGVAVAPTYGGIGALTPFAVGDLLYAPTTTTIGKLAAVATGQVLVSAGTTTAPAWSASPTLTGTATANNLTAAPTLSVEQITNFSGWTPTAGWTWTNGIKWVHGSGVVALASDWTPTAGIQYEIVIGITHAGTGGVTISVDGVSYPQITSTQTVTYHLKTGSTTAISILPTTNWTGSIDSCSVKVASAGSITFESGIVQSGQLLFEQGAAGYPPIACVQAPTTGIIFNSAPSIDLSIAGSKLYTFDAVAFKLISSAIYIALANGNTKLYGGTNELQMGADAASPTNQIFKGPDGLGANKPGGGIIFQGGAATGSGEAIGVKIQTTYSLPAITSPSTSTAQTQYTRKWEVGKVWSMTDAAAAAPIITITCPAAGFVNGKIIYSLECIDHDGEEMQGEAGEVTFSALQHAAGAAYHIVAPSEVSTQNLSIGALTTTWSMTSGSDVVLLNLAVDSDMDFTTAPATGHIWLRIQIILNSPQTITLN